MTKPKLNRPLFNKVCKAILKHHRQFNMDWWFQKKNSAGNPAPRCGTAACLAGWAVAVGKKEKTLRDADNNNFDVKEVAQELLGLSENNVMNLFDAGMWPDKFYNDYCDAVVNKSTLGAARAAVARVKHFLKTGK